MACLAVFAACYRQRQLAGIVSLEYLVWALIFIGAGGLAYLDGGAGKVEPAAGSFLAPQVSGVLLGFVYLWLEPMCVQRYQNWQLRRLEIDRRRVGQIRRQVDELLHKISEQGYDSLTGQEKSFLRQASKHFKND